MASFEVELKVPDIPTEGVFSRFFQILTLRKPRAEQKIRKLLLPYARDGHRKSSGRHYNRQTGQLAKATKMKGDLSTEMILYTDETQAPYVYWIITGKRTGSNGKIVKWNNGHGDPYIDEAIEANKEKIEEIIRELYDGAVTEWNSSETF